MAWVVRGVAAGDRSDRSIKSSVSNPLVTSHREASIREKKEEKPREEHPNIDSYVRRERKPSPHCALHPNQILHPVPLRQGRFG